jgi:hypothetical protein
MSAMENDWMRRALYPIYLLYLVQMENVPGVDVGLATFLDLALNVPSIFLDAQTNRAAQDEPVRVETAYLISRVAQPTITDIGLATTRRTALCVDGHGRNCDPKEPCQPYSIDHGCWCSVE